MSDDTIYGFMSPSSYIREDGHWGADLDFLKDTANKLLTKSKNKIDYLDIGCGPGFHLIAMRRWYPELRAAGADLSVRMLSEARKEIRRARLEDIELVHSDISDLQVRKKYDLISFLNNGMGNVYREEASPVALRENAMRKMRSLVRKGGYLITSVYNLEKLAPRYGPNLRMLPHSNISRGDLFVEYKHGNGRTEYYSHWFTEKELRDLLEQNGFKINLFEKRMARLVVRAKAM